MALPSYTEADMSAPPPRTSANRADVDKINTLREFCRDLSTAISSNPIGVKKRKKILKTGAVADYLFDLEEEYISGSVSVMLAGRNLLPSDITFSDSDDFCEFQLSDDPDNGVDGYVKINPSIWADIKETDKLYFEYNVYVDVLGE
jgi:hypothetical protein